MGSWQSLQRHTAGGTGLRCVHMCSLRHWFVTSCLYRRLTNWFIHLTFVGVQADPKLDNLFHHAIKTVNQPARDHRFLGTESKPNLLSLSFTLESEFSEWFSEAPSLWCKRQTGLEGRGSQTQHPSNNSLIISTNPFKLQQSNYLLPLAWVDV